MQPKNPSLLSTIPSTAVGVDKAIESVRIGLDSLAWLSPYNYGRAWTDTTETGLKKPIVYAGVGEYMDALPNDYLAAMSFFRVISPETTNYNNAQRRGAPISSERDVSLIVWVNLKELNHSEAGSDYIYTEVLKEEVYNVLKDLPEVIAISSYQDDDIAKVYEGYDFERYIADYAEKSVSNYGDERTLAKKVAMQSNYMKHPFAAFRVDLTLKYSMSC